MGEMADRWRTVAGAFTERVEDTPVDRWQSPTPCEGWVAIDVVRHLVEWVPGFFGAQGVDLGPIPDVEADPLAAWRALDTAVQRRLDEPALATEVIDGPMGPMPFEQLVGAIVLADVLIHTWDLARAVGLDESLDEAEVGGLVAGMDSMPVDAMRDSGHFGPRVEVPEDADEQTQLLAFMGRQP